MGVILKVASSQKSTLSIDAYLLEEQSAKFHPDPIINDGALAFFEEIAPTRRTAKTTATTR